MTAFSDLLRHHRRTAGYSYGQLADLTHWDRSHIAHLEAGRRAPSPEFAAVADAALGAGGSLVAAQEREDAVRQADARTRRTLAASLAASRDLAALAELELDDLASGAAETAVDYLSSPPAPMLQRAHALRDVGLERLRDHRHGPGERGDLLVTVGRLSGVLAYAALDLGDADAAHEHAYAAGRCAQLAGDLELLLWVRGTQSLISRFAGDYEAALDFVEDGIGRGGPGVPGTGMARLLSGRAQCLANLGDSPGTHATLDLAERAHDAAVVPDSVAGLFAFSPTKRAYYAGSSLIWPGGQGDAARAEREAGAAITQWQAMPAGERSLDDERLAHVYVATARVQQGDVEGATAAMAPILTLPEDAQISWIGKRAARVGALLAAPRFRGGTAADDLREAIRAIG
ncbi:helix-turn-helix domain-containing protein [Streptomyces lonarensis]|uniref:Helix-turn-helix domain-containing protein n=1 Tax=Streptomyces lonarensis TaxID=700599 RepID=A0A7X6HX81_9ACTN|nr:helix-turn-helix transcriptional regulator [Streptomyces lonarensis]NJQ04258.1 helix-turn-helix domain-containing protein [Streptomyces lonarensis]